MEGDFDLSRCNSAFISTPSRDNRMPFVLSDIPPVDMISMAENKAADPCLKDVEGLRTASLMISCDFCPSLCYNSASY